MNIFADSTNFIFPVFVYDDETIYRNSLHLKYLNDSKVFIKDIPDFIQGLMDFSINNILVFGVPAKRNSLGTAAFEKKGVTQRSIKKIKELFGKKINVISDVCVCQYNLSGHCGIYTHNYKKNKNNQSNLNRNKLDNDETLKILGKITLSLAESGTDFIAPSSMMDGQVFYLKRILKDNNYDTVKIMSYSSKHNSCLYSPFRNNNFYQSVSIDKSYYQNSYHNLHESLREVTLDINEGADWVMIKPSFWYMDIIKALKSFIKKPLVVQNVSGEYALIKSASVNNWIDGNEWAILSLLSLKRAGADKIISYFIVSLLKKYYENK
ncbi:MAG TPA: porphobilinogen synthase [Verrucomicrobiae bacterium]|nr:porphobilinogen synthase [Verrucomicrobiae bacterium]